MKRTRSVALSTIAAVAALITAGCTSSDSETTGDAGTTAEDDTLTVFVAASLVDVVEHVSAATDLDVTVSAAGSSDLVSQILAGAPADVLVTADETTMARAVDEGAVEEPEVVALNHPALIVPAGNPAGVTGLDDSLADAALVICAPQVPCGAASAELADLVGIELDPVSEAPNVTDVLGSVTSAEADAGIVYITDVLRGGEAIEQIEVPEAEQVTNAYPAAVVAGTERPDAAQEWLAALTGGAGREALSEAGFVLP